MDDFDLETHQQHHILQWESCNGNIIIATNYEAFIMGVTIPITASAYQWMTLTWKPTNSTPYFYGKGVMAYFSIKGFKIKDFNGSVIKMHCLNNSDFKSIHFIPYLVYGDPVAIKILVLGMDISQLT